MKNMTVDILLRNFMLGHNNNKSVYVTDELLPNVEADSNKSHIIELQLNIPYTVLEILVALIAIIGNAMVITVFHRERQLRRRTNYYIIALAMADLLVGLLGIPFAILASIGLPTNAYGCLFTVSMLIVLCTISIFCLVAVSIDRYWAILYPLAYSRNIRTKTAIIIISVCYALGCIVGFLPLFGWHAAVGKNQTCLFVEVMDYNYLVFLYIATIITPAFLLLVFYVHIYTVIIKQVRHSTVTISSSGKSGNSKEKPIKMSISKTQGGTMLRVLGAARKREVKATQNLSIIVLFFMLCWLPLYTINCVKAFCHDCYIHSKLTLFCIILSHLNSAVNPLLYAYHLKDFRAALKSFIFKILGKETPQPDIIYRFSIAGYQQRKSVLEINKRPELQNSKIYVNSPTWFRNQQQILKDTVTSNKKPKDQLGKDNEMWKIVEVSILPSENENCNSVNELTRRYNKNMDNIVKDSACTFYYDDLDYVNNLANFKEKSSNNKQPVDDSHICADFELIETQKRYRSANDVSSVSSQRNRHFNRMSKSTSPNKRTKKMKSPVFSITTDDQYLSSINNMTCLTKHLSKSDTSLNINKLNFVHPKKINNCLTVPKYHDSYHTIIQNNLLSDGNKRISETKFNKNKVLLSSSNPDLTLYLNTDS